jgi:hypothetical protein
VQSIVPDPQSFYEIGLGFSLMGAYFGIIIPITISATALTLMCLLSARNAGMKARTHTPKQEILQVAANAVVRTCVWTATFFSAQEGALNQQCAATAL